MPNDRQLISPETRLRQPRQLVMVLLVAAGIAGYFQMMPNALLALVATVSIFFWVFLTLDEGLPLSGLAALLAALQWLAGPALAFSTEISEARYNMYVDQSTYFSFALPGTCLYAAALIGVAGIPTERIRLAGASSTHFFQIGVFLLVLSLASQFAASKAPGSLQFFFHLVTQVRYIGALYLLFSNHRFKWVMIAASLSSLFIRTAEAGMFHDLILWLMLIGCYWYFSVQRTKRVKAVFFIAGALFVLTAQTIKKDYREQIETGKEPSLISMAYEALSEGRFFSRADVREGAIVRLNQGWIISAIMNHVPERESHASGETISTAMGSAFLPRFVSPNKKRAGGQENFRRFTGLMLADSTSMGISPLGEAYANYGIGGGIIFMLIWGAAFGGVLSLITRYGQKNPQFLLWTPLIIYQALKAETEMSVVLNQLTKGAIVAFGVYYLVHRILIPDVPKAIPERPRLAGIDRR